MRLRPAAAILAFTLSVPFPSFAREPADAWVRVRAGESGVTMSGEMSDIERAREAQSRSEESLMWFRRGNKVFVIRDAQVLEKLEQVFDGVHRLEGKIQKVQKAHQVIQGRIDDLADKVGTIGSRMGDLGQELAELDSDDDERRAALEGKMRKLEQELRKVERPMNALIKATEPLRTEMSRISDEIRRAMPNAEARMRQIFDAAIADGIAERQ